VTTPWTITSNIILIASSLDLKIQNPTSGTPAYVLSIVGTLRIGSSILVSVAVRLLNNSTLKISLTANGQNSASSILATLVSDSNITIPQGAPLDIESPSATFTMDIICLKSSTAGWALQEVDLKLQATLPWNLGPSSTQLVITNLSLEARFSGLNSGNSQKVIKFAGTTSFGDSLSSSSAAFTAVLDQSSIILSIDIAGSTNTGAATIISHYVANWNSVLAAPELTSDTGLSNYGSKVVSSASITFVQAGTGYSPSSLAITVGTGSGFSGWSLVDNYLILTQLELSLNVTDLATSPTLNASLKGTMDYQSRSRVMNQMGIIMIATRRDLTCHVTLVGCNFQEMIFVATAGEWDLSGNWMDMKSLDLHLNWYEKRGSFVATLENWTLTGNASIMAMLNPRLSLNVSKATVNLQANGMIAGEASVFGEEIPITFELPDGPLRIFGYDIREIYKMCKRLRELYDDAEEIAKIMADIVGASEAQAVGEAVSATFLVFQNMV